MEIENISKTQAKTIAPIVRTDRRGLRQIFRQPILLFIVNQNPRGFFKLESEKYLSDIFRSNFAFL